MTIFKRELNAVRIIVIHCSDSERPEHDNISVINNWHIKRGFAKVGYHFYIQKSGKIQVGRGLYEVGAHAAGFNSESVGICLGGKLVFSEAQIIAAARLISNLARALPNLRSEYWLIPHRFLDRSKTCPNFNLSRIDQYLDADLDNKIDCNGKNFGYKI